MTLTHRPYQPADRDECIAIFRSNVPRFFRDHELEDFVAFLDKAECPYFVVQADALTVGCGGFGIRKGSDTADLCWGMIHREQQGQRIGAYLLCARLHAIITSTDARYVRLGTSQHTEGFFRRFGFAIQSTISDGIATGLDDVEMKLDLSETNRESIKRWWQDLAG